MAKRAESYLLDLGATALADGRTRFRVWAPYRERVQVRIVKGPSHFIDKDLERHERGYWEGDVFHVQPGTRYAFLLDGSSKGIPDPASRSQPDGVHGFSEVISPDSFEWNDAEWSGIPLEDLLIYELHVGTFTPYGTFDAVVERLPYLAGELGINAIELMPVAQFPGKRNWGYDGAFLYAVQCSYGGPEGLRRLVDACHQQGVAVILDVVYNHLGHEGNYLWEFGPYFSDCYRTPWGSTFNYDGPDSDEVRHYIISNALYWIDEYHIDALRLDAVHGIFDFSARHILDELSSVVHASFVGQQRPPRRPLVLAESDLNDPRLIRSPERGGFGLDAQWNDDCHNAIHAHLTGERVGYYADFGRTEQIARAYSKAFVMAGDYSIYRKRSHGAPARDLPPSKFIVFVQNHDQVGNRAGGERLSSLVSFEQQKLVAAMLLLSPYVPLLFMGEEYGETAPFQYFTSFVDPVLAEAVKEGRKEELASFGWNQEVPDPQSRETFERSKLHLEHRNRGAHRSLFTLYQDLIALRREHPSLRAAQDRNGLEVDRMSDNILIVKRPITKTDWVALFNLGPEKIAIDVSVKPGEYDVVLDTAWQKYGGPLARAAMGDETPLVVEDGAEDDQGLLAVKLEPWSARLLRG